MRLMTAEGKCLRGQIPPVVPALVLVAPVGRHGPRAVRGLVAEEGEGRLAVPPFSSMLLMTKSVKFLDE